jgi:hypothetical protein
MAYSFRVVSQSAVGDSPEHNVESSDLRSISCYINPTVVGNSPVATSHLERRSLMQSSTRSSEGLFMQTPSIQVLSISPVANPLL